ncbi:MarC family protein [uncultured Abyssibacter sp.]|uniref:MarC family protein n=1 Tax=uncultured Abyssibacter sp. TaxID=2320202 RepID=UPI0032B15050
MTDKLIRDALILWATIDPIGTLAIFASITGGLTEAARRRTALKAVLYAGCILVGAVVIGQVLLTAMGIRLVSLQVAGGIILFLFGLKMVFGTPLTQQATEGEPGHDIAVFPLAVPSIATPGALMAVIILTDNHVYPIQVQLATTGVMLLVLLATFLFMLAAGRIIAAIGQNGSAILVRVMGMLLAALSIELVMEALNIFDLLNTSTN